MSRVVWLRKEEARDEASNDRTLGLSHLSMRIWRSGPGDGAPPASFEEAFRRHYSVVRDLLNEHTEPGLALVAVGPSGVEAAAWFEAKADEANPLILGRHSSAEIFVPADPALSLRHLALVLRARKERAPVRVRVLDLRTATGFQDEQGRRLEALESEGPLMVRCASLGVMLFPTAASGPVWPEDPGEAWARIPERVYADAREAASAREPRNLAPEWQAVVEPSLADPGAVTLVPSFPGPVFASRDLAGSEAPRGELLIASPAGKASLRLGARALEQGVLLGRYERCDTAGLPVLSDASLSRVHLLVIELDGVFYAIDSASKNGTWQGGHPLRAAKLQPGAPLRLARDATVEWRVLH